MKKEKITFDQLAAGSLLKFGKLESTDMSLLIKEISKFADVELPEDINFEKYILMSDGSILLNEKYVYNFYSNGMYCNLMNMVQDTAVEEYFSNLNVSDFVLRKINMVGLGLVIKDGLRDIFSKRQIEELDGLYEKNYIENYMQKDVIYGDYEAIKVTQEGKLKLFYIEHSKKMEDFLNLLRDAGIADEIIEEYFLGQDFDSMSCDEILAIDNFGDFYSNYNSKKKRK